MNSEFNNNFWDSFLLSEGIIYNNDDNKLCKDSDLIISDINLELQMTYLQ